jgi:uncharacterized protein YjbJ (UPF0337 family)
MNNSTTSGVFNEAKGKLKQAVGETFNDQSLANEGAADQLKGNAQQTWGSVKDTAHEIAHNHASNRETPYDSSNPSYSTDPAYRDEHAGHDIRTSITNAAENVKESIQRGLDHIEHHDKH